MKDDMTYQALHPMFTPILGILAVIAMSSCGDFNRALSKHIGFKATKHFEQGDMEAALADTETAVRLDPDNWRLRDLLGKIHFALGDPDTALAAQDRAIALLEKTETGKDSLELKAKLLNTRSSTHGALGNSVAAIADLEVALELTPNSTETVVLLTWVLATNPSDALRNGDRALELMNQHLLATPDSEFIIPFGTLAAIYAENGDFGSAVEHQKLCNQIITFQRVISEADLPEDDERLKAYENGKPWHEDAAEAYRKKHAGK